MTFLMSMPGGSEWLILLFVMVVFLLPIILFLISIQGTLNEVSFENRKMQPGQVWLMLIPFFGLIWQFFVVGKLADSLRAEFLQRKIPLDEERPGFNLGLSFCILSCCFIIPVIGTFASIAALICLIIYWVKINNYKRLLIQSKFI